MNFLDLDSNSLYVYDKIKEIYGDGFLSDLYLNKSNIKSVISYLKSLGIKCINELLIYKIDVFFKDVDFLECEIKKFDVSEFVNLVNDDYFMIDNYLF
ncbi:MAG: hypothetical protein IJB83_02810 [Bacilli bacterium]|nr:hypothetical protein [Bacilli bacterium]